MYCLVICIGKTKPASEKGILSQQSPFLVCAYLRVLDNPLVLWDQVCHMLARITGLNSFLNIFLQLWPPYVRRYSLFHVYDAEVSFMSNVQH